MSKIASTQIKVTVPQELYFFIKSRADKFGLAVSTYTKNLLINDVKDMEIPTFEMGKKLEQLGDKAVKEYENGKTIKIKNIEEFFDNL